MTDQSNIPGDGPREEIELLLPWYVNGTLDPDDTAKVEAYLNDHPEMAVQMATLREDMHESIVANEAITGPGRNALDRLMADVEREMPMQHRARQAGKGLLATVDGFLRSLSPGRLGFAAMAAALVIMLQAGIVGTMMLNPPGGGATYQTASGGKELTGTFVLVRFKAEAPFAKVGAMLAEEGAEIVAGPKPGGLYRVRISAQKLADAERQAAIEKLRGHAALVNMVLPSQ